MVATPSLRDRLRAEPRLLPRLATLIENGDPHGLAALDTLYPFTGGAHIVGITGPPGAGKSSLIAALVSRIRANGRRAAVIAIDPTSLLSGGAVLGDRVRMMEAHADDGVFIRSMASRGRQGGLAWATAELMHLLDAAGFPVILIETVGTGQDGTDIANLADSVVVVEAPGLGDGVQAIKSGLLEIGDVVVVNKADLPGAAETLRTLRVAFGIGRPNTATAPTILGTVSTTGEGIAELLTAIDAHGRLLDQSGELLVRRERGVRTEILAGIRAVLERRFHTTARDPDELTYLLGRVTRRELTPRRAVEAIVRGSGVLSESVP